MSELKKLSSEKQELVNEILEMIKNDSLSWKKVWKSLEAPNNPVTDKKYRGTNNVRLLVSSAKHKFKDPRWVTFNQARQKGWKVKKGEKATPIYYYQLTDRKTKKAFISEMVENMSEKDRNDYFMNNVYYLTKKYSVFNGEQLEGIEKYRENIRYDSAGRNEILEKMIDSSEAEIIYDQLDRAFYSPGKDTIHLPERERFNSIEELYSVALHEMAHSTGHPDRLDRNLSGKYGDRDYAREELIAEFSSIFIQQETELKVGRGHMENNAAYIKSWNSVLEKNPEILFEAISEAQKVNDYILEPYRKELEKIKDAEYEKSEEKEELKNLKVTLHYSEAMNEEEVTYEGRKAYEFLEKIRDMDREQHKKISGMKDINGNLPEEFTGLVYYKTKITFEEKDYRKTERIDIGDGKFTEEKISENLRNYNIESKEISKYEEKKATSGHRKETVKQKAERKEKKKLKNNLKERER